MGNSRQAAYDPGVIHQKIRDVALSDEDFHRSWRRLWEIYDTTGYLRSPEAKQLLKEVVSETGVSLGDLINYFKFGRTEKDPAKTKTLKRYEEERQKPHVMNSQGAKSREPHTMKTRQAARKTSRRQVSQGTRRAKLDIMTGFSGIKDPEADEGLQGQDYFKRWTTVALPDQGRNESNDDDQQPTGSGAPETSFPDNPLKVPMEADDVKRPKIREGREAARNKLRRVAAEIRLLNPVLARRLLAAADELPYDDLSTGALPVAGDEPNEVDDSQDQGHGTLSFFGTDPARSTSLTRKSSRRIQANPCEVKKVDDGYILVNDRGKKVKGPFKSKSEAYEAKLKFVEEEESEEREGKMEFASRRRGAVGKNPQDPDIDFDDAVKMVKRALRTNDNEYKNSVRTIWNKESKRVDALLQPGGSTSPQQAAASQGVQQGDQRQGSRQSKKRRKEQCLSSRIASDSSQTFEAALNKAGIPVDKEPVPDGVSYVLSTKDFSKVRQLARQLGASAHETQEEGGVAVEFRGASRLARAQGDKPLKPEAANPDDDGLGAGGAGGFYRETKAPLQKSMNADDVERPRIRENPEASKSLWAAFKSAIIRKGDVGGTWNDGRYTIASRDYGNTLEITASVQDREGVEYPVGNMTFSVLNDSPSGRFASVEMNDGLIENRVLELTMKPRTAARIISWVFNESKDLSKATLESVG